eukprot:NODE_2356_length_1441_cov_143.674507_g2239_i0.p1 GENE.NODE_2356_length_1441_cov_143.674507_g2239_i0~~NODE_2356_length_1441_cov_143.674507_g2239_i0.p1  ORF type:complete len:400 (+),score=52.99 NODE_2356_length_1441_cov_143.674507_g2239_i0:55-1200(+)
MCLLLVILVIMQALLVMSSCGADGIVAEENPPYSRRSSNAVFSNDPMGYAHGRGMLDDIQALSHDTAYGASMYYQLDLGSVHSVAGVVTQARANLGERSDTTGYDYQYVKTYNVTISSDGSTFVDVDGGATFTGNAAAGQGRVQALFSGIVTARYVRLFPVTWSSHPSWRVGILYCGTFAAVYGDPHFKSFSGGTYDIMGQGGHNYSSITDTNFLWNMQFIRRRDDDLKGSYIGTCAFRIFNDTYLLNPTLPWGVEHNGKRFHVSNTRVHLNTFPSAADPYYFVRVMRRLAIIRAPCFRIELRRAFKRSKGVRFDHFTTVATILPHPRTCNPHGLLGQTYHFKKPVVPMGHNGEGVIEGVLSDYEVSDLFSTKFRFNRYTY